MSAVVKPEPQEASVPDQGPSKKRPRTEDPRLQGRSPAAHQPASANASSSSSSSSAYPSQPEHYDTAPVPPSDALLPSFFAIEPYDEFQKRVADWIWSVSRGHQHIEIEAKIGTIRSPVSKRRIQLPTECESTLLPSANPHTDPLGLTYIFDSDMPATQHKHYNKLLNNQAQAARHTPHPIKYQHLHETDIFRKVGNKKIRIRQDKKTQTVVQVCEKVRLGDLNVFCPMRKFDWRLSVSTETPLREVPQGPDLNVRSKDRLSYEHQVVQVDLTQVTTDDGKKRHELEVEIVNAPLMLAEAEAAEKEENNCYEQLVAVLVSSVRLLIRNAS